MKKLLKEIKLSFYLTIALIFFLIISNVIHEMGHYLAARAYGYDAILHYNMTSVDFVNSSDKATDVHSFWIAVAGSVQAVILGVVGLIALSKHGKSFNKIKTLHIHQWFLIFLALSFLKYSVNFFLWMIIDTNTFSNIVRPDEIRIAEYLNIPDVLILAVLALLGILILRFVLKHYIHESAKSVLIISIFFAYLLFFMLWMTLLGPWLLP